MPTTQWKQESRVLSWSEHPEQPTRRKEDKRQWSKGDVSFSANTWTLYVFSLSEHPDRNRAISHTSQWTPTPPTVSHLACRSFTLEDAKLDALLPIHMGGQCHRLPCRNGCVSALGWDDHGAVHMFICLYAATCWHLKPSKGLD